MEYLLVIGLIVVIAAFLLPLVISFLPSSTLEKLEQKSTSIGKKNSVDEDSP